jgi:hypothetical protein
MSIVLMHIYCGMVEHFIIHAYIECRSNYTNTKHSITFDHPIDLKYFKKLDHMLHHAPKRMVIALNHTMTLMTIVRM